MLCLRGCVCVEIGRREEAAYQSVRGGDNRGPAVIP